MTDRQSRVLMGRGGRKIRELQDITGAAIAKLAEESTMEACKFNIYGSDEANEKVLEIIYSMFEQII